MPNRRHHRAFVVVVVVIIAIFSFFVFLLSLHTRRKWQKKRRKREEKLDKKLFTLNYDRFVCVSSHFFSLFPSHTGVPSAALYPQAAAAAMSYPFYQPIIQPMVKFQATTNSNYCWVMHNSHFHMSPISRHRHYTPYILSPYTYLSLASFFLCAEPSYTVLAVFFVPSRGDKKNIIWHFRKFNFISLLLLVSFLPAINFYV